MKRHYSRSLKVICCCANWRIIALNSNSTSIFNHSWDITPSLHIHTPPLFRVKLEKDGWKWICFGVRVPRTLDYPNINLNLHLNLNPNVHCMNTIHAHPRRTDRWTNIMAIVWRFFVLVNASHVKKVNYVTKHSSLPPSANSISCYNITLIGLFIHSFYFISGWRPYTEQVKQLK